MEIIVEVEKKVVVRDAGLVRTLIFAQNYRR